MGKDQATLTITKGFRANAPMSLGSYHEDGTKAQNYKISTHHQEIVGDLQFPWKRLPKSENF